MKVEEKSKNDQYAEKVSAMYELKKKLEYDLGCIHNYCSVFKDTPATEFVINQFPILSIGNLVYSDPEIREVITKAITSKLISLNKEFDELFNVRK